MIGMHPLDGPIAKLTRAWNHVVEMQMLLAKYRSNHEAPYS
jgi:hypothetical protein